MLGVASYSLELLTALPNLDRVYVPLGLGSGICGMIAARNALGLSTEIIAVVAEQANTYQRSFAAGECRPTDSADTLADGLAVRVPSDVALPVILGNVSRIVAVSDDAVLQAVRHLFTDTHNAAEGAGAAALAAVLSESTLNAGKKVAAVLSGGNIDRAVFLAALDTD